MNIKKERISYGFCYNVGNLKNVEGEMLLNHNSEEISAIWKMIGKVINDPLSEKFEGKDDGYSCYHLFKEVPDNIVDVVRNGAEASSDTIKALYRVDCHGGWMGEEHNAMYKFIANWHTKDGEVELFSYYLGGELFIPASSGVLSIVELKEVLYSYPSTTRAD